MISIDIAKVPEIYSRARGVCLMATAEVLVPPLEIPPLVPSMDAHDSFLLDDIGRQMLAAMLAPGPEDETAPSPGVAAFSNHWQLEGQGGLAAWGGPALPAAGSAADGAAVAAALLSHCAHCSCRVVQRYTFVSGEWDNLFGGEPGSKNIDESAW